MKNFFLLCVLINCGETLAHNSNKTDYITTDELYLRMDNMIDSIDSTLELQNTAIALLQKKLSSYQKTNTVQLCVLSATVASLITWLILQKTS